MEFFNFGLEQKLDHHSCIEFHSDSDGDGFKAQKPIIHLNDLKNGIFQLWKEQKLDRHSCVEFHGDSDGDGFNFPKPELNSPRCPLGAPKNEIFQLWARTKVRPSFSCKIS